MDMTIFSKKIKIKTIKKNLQKLSKIILVLFIFISFFPLSSVYAGRIFDPNNIITDQELSDKDSLSRAAIQTFLERKNSVLSQYEQEIEGVNKKASEIIWEVGQKYSINPKFLLTTLEKEQGLISKSNATEKAIDWATGYSCFGGTCNERHKGFYNQVLAAAATQDIYRQRAGQFSFRVGQTTKTVDGYNVTPLNQATANLYIYTPYVGHAPELGINFQFGANKLFWRIWHRYFSEQKFLDGQIITHGGRYWLIKNNKKYEFASKELFLNDYKENDAINVSSKAALSYPDGPKIYFAENSLVKENSSSQIYLIAEGLKRPIIDNNALALLSDFRIAVSAQQIPTVSFDKLLAYGDGPHISASSIYPQGKLFRDEGGKIWQIKDNIRREVDLVVWQQRFNSQVPETINSSTLEGYLRGTPVRLKDGTFVENSGRYFLISNGKRMRIEDTEIFNRIFGIDKKNSALKISSQLLQIHAAGEVIDYIDDTIKDSDITRPAPPTAVNPPSVGNYQAVFESITPERLVTASGSNQTIAVQFKNTGSALWQKGNVLLKMSDRGKESSSFGVSEKINFDQKNVSSSQIATFTFDIASPTDKTGLLVQDFSLYYDNNGRMEKITTVGKAIVVRSGVSAQIIEHNIPIAVKNIWQPISITMKIKNTSSDTAWLSRRTALEIYNLDGTPSLFYDPKDWVRQEVAAVPINKSTIEPGEIGEFKFTLNPLKIRQGVHTLNFQLKLLDKNIQVFLNGNQEWHRQIRVD